MYYVALCLKFDKKLDEWLVVKKFPVKYLHYCVAKQFDQEAFDERKRSQSLTTKTLTTWL